MLPKIVVIDGGYDSYELEKRILKEAGYDLSVCKSGFGEIEKKLDSASGAIGLFVRQTVIDEQFIRRVPSVRAIVRYGVGYDNIDLKALSAKGVKAAIVKGYGSSTVAEHALTLMFACARSLLSGNRMLHTHFAQGPNPDTPELGESTLGIIGLGRIGSTLARKAQSLFPQIIACDPYVVADEVFDQCNVRKMSFEALLGESDFISLHCNLTDETTHLVDERAFCGMKKRPVLINTARGPVVDEQALLNALDEDRIHSAGIDVYEKEPPESLAARALIAHPRVVATGHYAFFSRRSLAELQRRAAENMVALLRGEPIDDCLNCQSNASQSRQQDKFR